MWRCWYLCPVIFSFLKSYPPGAERWVHPSPLGEEIKAVILHTKSLSDGKKRRKKVFIWKRMIFFCHEIFSIFSIFRKRFCSIFTNQFLNRRTEAKGNLFLEHGCCLRKGIKKKKRQKK